LQLGFQRRKSSFRGLLVALRVALVVEARQLAGARVPSDTGSGGVRGIFRFLGRLRLLLAGRPTAIQSSTHTYLIRIHSEMMFLLKKQKQSATSAN